MVRAHRRSIPFVALTACLLTVGPTAGRADVKLPSSQWRLDQAVGLGTGSYQSTTRVALDLGPTPMRLTLGVAGPDSGALGRSSLFGSLSWTWGERWAAPRQRSLELTLAVRSGGMSALGPTAVLGRVGHGVWLEVPVEWVVEGGGDGDAAITWLLDAAPMFGFGASASEQPAARAGVTVAWMAPRVLETRLRVGMTAWQRSSAQTRVHADLAPEMRLHLCSSRVPRLRRQVVYHRDSLCSWTFRFWGRLRQRVDATELSGMDWTLGLGIEGRLSP